MGKKSWVVIAALIAIVLAGATYLERNKTPEPKFRLEKVEQGDVVATVTASGTLSAVTTVKVGSQVSGIISKLYADFNSQVKKGQLLAELDPTPFQAAVDQRQADLQKAKVDLANSEINFTRQKNLAAQGLVPQSDFDAAKAARDGFAAGVKQAEAALKMAAANLTYTKITSPIDGIVVDRQYDIGQTVAASFQAPTLFTIAQDLTKMQVSADVSESDIGQIKVGEPVRFNVDAYPDRDFRGAVSQIRLNATVNQNVVTYPVIVEVSNTDLSLKPTMTANVAIDVATVRDVLRIPNAALRWKPEEKIAVSTSPEERAAKMAPSPGAASGGPATGGQQPAGAPAGGAPPGGGGSGAAAVQFNQTRGGTPGGGGPGGKGTGQKRTQSVVYLLDAGGAIKGIEIRSGISDGRNTQVVSGDLKPGDAVIIGLATAKVDLPGGPGKAGQPGPGGKRF
ncbi:MAG TPA: efflux RND transporter periplasmic adaptor subunit [Thermoanaerobaculia bacterium]|nr:efflux RND transporter periplasmic adaptor subunit [Thermoanaerobaculia bacterium]